jgi:hypothetical protein
LVSNPAKIVTLEVPFVAGSCDENPCVIVVSVVENFAAEKLEVDKLDVDSAYVVVELEKLDSVASIVVVPFGATTSHFQRRQANFGLSSSNGQLGG